MLSVKIVVVGNLKEEFFRAAEAEYLKRLGGFCKIEVVQLKEERVPDKPSQSEIEAVLTKESKAILAAVPQKAYKIAMCVEGKQLSSEELALQIDRVATTHGEICFIIGSSHGLSDSVKSACDLRLSVSKLTFPHQLMRVMMCEIIYRSMNILRGTGYHK